MTTVDVIASGPDISAFADTWEHLYSAGANQPSSSLEWTMALLRNHVEPGDRVLTMRLTRASNVVALVPLVVRPVRFFGFTVTTLSPLAERYNTHSDVLSSGLDRDAAAAFFRALDGLDIRWDLFRMASLLEDHAFVRYFDDDGAGSRATWQMRDGHPSYCLALPSSFDEYLAGRSAKFRNHLKRIARKIESSGVRSIAEIAKPADVERGYEMVLDVERGSWKDAHGTAITSVPRQAAFYRELCEGAAARGRLHLQVLTIDERPVAYNLGYLHGGCYSYLKTSFVEPLKPLGPATYLRARLVEDLICRGVPQMDFPAEPYEWERQWTDTVRWHKVLSVYAATPVGRALALADRVRHGSRTARTLEHVDPRAEMPVAR